jgi:hypothetical protein
MGSIDRSTVFKASPGKKYETLWVWGNRIKAKRAGGMALEVEPLLSKQNTSSKH